MNVTLDADILFNAVSEHSTKKLLRHIVNAAASASDYFLTTDKLLRRFRYPYETVRGCGSAPICTSPDDMRELL